MGLSWLIEDRICVLKFSCFAKFYFSTEEQNAAYTCIGAPTICNAKNSKYYSLDGSCNNIQHPRWGQMSTGYVRLLPAYYSDGINDSQSCLITNSTINKIIQYRYLLFKQEIFN